MFISEHERPGFTPAKTTSEFIVQCNLIFTLHEKRCQWDRFIEMQANCNYDVFADVAGSGQRLKEAMFSSTGSNSTFRFS